MSDPETLEPGLRRIVAPNPSAMTGPGTNTYLLGDDPITVIDPGPDMAAHLGAILRAVDGGPVRDILVTHAHLDHSGLAAELSRATGAPVLAFGPAGAGRSPVMRDLALPEGGRGIDRYFAPTRTLSDGEILPVAGAPLTALWTPGHFGNHLAFGWRDAIFTGDLVMGWSSTVISPPDGDLGDYITSCLRLHGMAPRRLFPAHGMPVDAPRHRIDDLLAHRQARSDEILECLTIAPADAAMLTARIYDGLPANAIAAARGTVLAHLIHLWSQGILEAEGRPSLECLFSRC